MKKILYTLLSLSILCEGAEKVGSVTSLEGNLTAINSNHGRRELQVQGDVFLGDTLITEAMARAEILFTDGTSILLIPRSRYTIDDYANRSGKSVYLAHLREGGIKIATGLIAKKTPENFTINTPDATIGVKGTRFVARLANNQLNVGSSQGQVTLSNRGGQVTLNPGEYGVVKSFGVTPEISATMPEVLAPSVFSAPNATGVASVQGSLATTDGFAWGIGLGAAAVIGTVVGVVVNAATQSSTFVAHSH